MDNPETLTNVWTQDTDKQNTKTQHKKDKQKSGMNQGARDG